MTKTKHEDGPEEEHGRILEEEEDEHTDKHSKLFFGHDEATSEIDDIIYRV